MIMYADPKIDLDDMIGAPTLGTGRLHVYWILLHSSLCHPVGASIIQYQLLDMHNPIRLVIQSPHSVALLLSTALEGAPECAVAPLAIV